MEKVDDIIKLCLSDNYEQLEQYIQKNKIDLSKRSNITGRTIFEVLALNEKSSQCLSSLMLLKKLGTTLLPVATSHEFLADLEQLKALPKGTTIYPTKRLAYSTAIKKITESKNVPPERVVALMIMSDQKIVPKQLREFATQDKANELLRILNLKNSLHKQRLFAFLMSSKEKKSDEKKESLIKNGFWRNPLYDKNVLKIVNGFMTSEKEKPGICFCLPRFAAVFKKKLADSKRIKIGISYDNEFAIRKLFLTLKCNSYKYDNILNLAKKNINGIEFEIYIAFSYKIIDSVAHKCVFFSEASQYVNIMLFLGKSLKAMEYARYTPHVEGAKLLRICYAEDFFPISQSVQLKEIPIRDTSVDKFRRRFTLDILPRMCEKTLFEQLLLKLHSAYISPQQLPMTTEYYSESPEPPQRSRSKCSLM